MKPRNYPVDPPQLWDHFYDITQIPRPSGAEAALREHIIRLAVAGGHDWRSDEAGNLLVSVAARGGLQDAEPVIIQNHLDMVTVKAADRDFDFDTDPLDLVVEGGWLRADRTTLGADNGVGCAAALALMTDPDVKHPPLELLFTVDEESGLHGALALDRGLLRGSRMLNLDTEEWLELYVGCAGGAGWEFRRAFATGAAARDAQGWQISLSGLAGGHSGIQIHEQLGNAIKLLAQCLVGVPGLQLAAADVGVAHNVIPREGSVTFACAPGAGQSLADGLARFREQVLAWLPPADHALQLELVAADVDEVLGEEDSAVVLDLLAAMPHGALAYDRESPEELVELSINLALLRLTKGELFLESSYRFFNPDQSLHLQQSVLATARAFDLQVMDTVGYPGWEPRFDGELLALARELQLELFGVAPAVKAIHAGLECGIVKSKKPELDILSFGPTIRGAHSPAERLKIDTVAPFWRFLTELLARM